MERVIVGYCNISDDNPEAWVIDEEKWAQIAKEVEEFRKNSSTTYLYGESEETMMQYAGRHTNLDPELCLWVEEVE